jgi:protein-tyrosine phosphatase
LIPRAVGYAPQYDAVEAAGGDPEIPKAILGVEKEYLEATFGGMTEGSGTIENYISEALGMDAAQQKALRAVCST